MIHTQKKRIFAESLVLSLCELGKSKLRFLKVTSGESDGSYDFMFDASSSIPHLLEELTLYPNCYISENPSWMSSMRDLTKLNIMVNPVTQEAVDIFGNLPVLQFLVLSSKVILSKGIIIESGTFKCLKVFRLYCRDIDIGLTFKARAMQRIEKLTLPFKAHEPQPVLCGNDFGIRHLCALKYLEARISCRGAAAWEVEELDAAIRDAASLLPSHPVTRILMYYTEKMINDKKEKKSATGKSLYSGECFGSMEDHSYHHPHLHHIVHSGEEDPNSCSIC